MFLLFCRREERGGKKKGAGKQIISYDKPTPVGDKKGEYVTA